MIRRLIPLAALASLLAACASSGTSAAEPAAPGTSRAEDVRAPGEADVRGRSGRRGQVAPREDMLMRGITLTADQQQRILAIRTSYRTQIEQLRADGGADRRAMRDRVQALMEKQRLEVRAVLTADQQVQHDRNVTEMRERMPRGGGRRPERDARA